jgi:hypothetical protein
MNDLTKMTCVGLDKDTIFFYELGNWQQAFAIVREVSKKVFFSNLGLIDIIHQLFMNFWTSVQTALHPFIADAK